MILLRKKGKNPDDFWREYEEQIGEKVISRSLGRYVSGWEEFDSQGWTGIWGLIIATTGGFRFHHFPQISWITALSRLGNVETQKEKTIFIPKENIISAQLIEESKWWKKIFSPSSPQLIVNYRDLTGNEQRLLLEAEFNSGDLAGALN